MRAVLAFAQCRWLPLRRTRRLIIFDDMDFTDLTAEATIRLLDMERSRSVRCRYNNGTLPQYMPRIFTTNSQLTGRRITYFLEGATPSSSS